MQFLPPISIRASRFVPSRWDVLAALLVLGFIVVFADASELLREPLATLAHKHISLNPWRLPDYAMRTALRMLIAMLCSLLFTFSYATLAAKSARAGALLIPLLDILQSVPILGFISITVVFFLSLAPGRVFGAELAAIFAIFTSQAWNMAFSFYQSLRTVPKDLVEVSASFRFSGWQKFWFLEVPFAIPGLIWNMMMSVSGGWFFVVASEAITVGGQSIQLPGIGSYIAVAIEKQDLPAIYYAVLVMFIVIVLYDQLLFRPLLAWSRKFKIEELGAEEPERPWFLVMVQRARIFDLLEL